MDIWTIPLIFVTLLICLISFISVRKLSKAKKTADGQTDINGGIEDNIITFNPYIWVILIAVSFMGIIIFYYATSFY